VKVKIYSILLLFSFLVILSHEIIPHHHHEDFSDNSWIIRYKVEEHSHNGKVHFHHSHTNEKHNDDSDSKDQRKRSFPIHHHFFASDDFDFIRLKTKNTKPNHASLVQLFLTKKISLGLFNPSDNQCPKFPDHPPRIKALFKPGTIGLRAPPC
jgi:hypothetical protein